MSFAPDYVQQRIAAEAASDARAAFIRQTYGHLAGAILAFILVETALVKLVPQEMIMGMLSGMSWLLVLGAFMVVSFVANRWAHSDTSRGMQYLGLAAYVVAEAVIFLPLLYLALKLTGDTEIIFKAGILTLTVFGGLTAVTFFTGNDFSYLRTFLTLGTFVAFGVLVVSMFIGTGIGLWFSFAMVGLSCCFILYETSNVLHYYRTDQYVAASLTLFASIALLFWYILQIMLSSSSRN